MVKRFDTDFRRLVGSRIEHMIRMHAYMVHAGFQGFTDAYCSIWHFATSRGALHLSDGLLEELEEWIECALANAIEAWDALTREQRIQALREM